MMHRTIGYMIMIGLVALTIFIAVATGRVCAQDRFHDRYAPWFERHRVGPRPLPRANSDEWRGCRNCYREPQFRARRKICRDNPYTGTVTCN